ncbi:hypothetical protein LMIY3S_01772 [Labrys miyagiensis]
MGQLSEDQYRFVAQEVYKNERENQKTAMQLQGDYGKWLLNTLLILNGGAVIGLAQSSAFGKSALHEAGMWFVGGIVSALACGFVAWVNWSLLAHYYEDWADPHMTFDVERWPRST